MNSAWYRLVAVFYTQLQALAQAQACGWAENPPMPLDTGLAQQGRLLLVVPRGDSIVRSEGALRDQRRARVVVGAWAVPPSGQPAAQQAAQLAQADALHFAARRLIKSAAFRTAILAAAGDGYGGLREVEVEPELKDISSAGSLLLSAYEVDYFQAYETPAP